MMEEDIKIYLKYDIYIVGGYVRDKLLGLNMYDVDFSFVITNQNESTQKCIDIYTGYKLMKEYLLDNNFDICKEYQNTVTIKAKFPKTSKYNFITQQFDKPLIGDFVLARKEEYNRDTRIPFVSLGRLEDDLLRRDFTVNAMAFDLSIDKMDSTTVIDMFDGQKDLKNKILRTPRVSYKTMYEDPLRILRAFRFNITKNFEFTEELEETFTNNMLLNRIFEIVSIEHIREELYKMFKHSTSKSLHLLNKINNPEFIDKLFKNIWLKPTLEN